MKAFRLLPLCLMLSACQPAAPDTFCQEVAAKKEFCMRARVDCQKVMLEAPRVVVAKVQQCAKLSTPPAAQSTPPSHPEIGVIPCCI